MTAWLLRIPTAIQEQNALPGVTNKILGKFVDAIFLSFEGALPFFPYSRSHVLGNPIRRGLLENFLRSKVQHDLHDAHLRRLARREGAQHPRARRALAHLQDLKGQIVITHQTGEERSSRR